MKILLGITGSVAATLAPKMVDALFLEGYEVTVITTDSSKNFFNEKELTDKGAIVYFDKSEWDFYHLHKTVLHIDLVKWADCFLIAPCTANTLSKIHVGICDNLLTCCVRAWPKKRKIVLAPAMNCEMFEKKILDKQYEDLVLYGNYSWVAPQNKKLFCGDEGVGAMARIEDIIKRLKICI